MKDILKYFDKFTFATLLLVTGLGIVLIYSASSGMSTAYWAKQFLWAVLALIAFFVTFKINTERIFRYAMPLYAALSVLLVVQILAGGIIAGTKSWIKTGLFNIQVSELMKVALALYLSKILAKMAAIDWKDFFKLGALIGGPFLLIALQPDLGTAAMLTCFLIIAILLKGIRPIIIIFSLVVLAAGSLYLWNSFLKPYQQARIIAFLNPGKYEKSAGYQVIQAKIAIGSGDLQEKDTSREPNPSINFYPPAIPISSLRYWAKNSAFWGLVSYSCCFLSYFTGSST